MNARRLVSVNLVHEIRADPHGDVGRTAIDKRPTSSRVALSSEGPLGDTVMDRMHHGGVDQAVYAYASEDLRAWSHELQRDIAPGLFGENLTTSGIDVTGSVIGSIWDIGGTRLQVRVHRTPCSTFQDWLSEPHWVKRFTDWGAPGAYLKVLTPGAVQAGDEIIIESVPSHGVTIGDTFRGRRGDRDKLQRLLDENDISADLVEYVQRELAVGEHQRVLEDS